MEFFDRNKVKKAIKNSILRVYEAQIADLDLYRNTLDCFSASIDSLVQGISLDEWMLQEKERQVQKTKQNAIGTLHEEILGAIDGVSKLSVGHLIDLESRRHNLVAEVKNKHNTTKGNHKVAVYHDLAKAIESRPGYTGYYVEILPSSSSPYNKPFTPSDNKTKRRLPSRNDIRVIDGKSFYKILTGSDKALLELYEELPSIVSEILREEKSVSRDPRIITESSSFIQNFVKAYGR